ncbi:MAG: hypothetical protein R3A13_10915 [Bdellovibrionota bacterium]
MAFVKYDAFIINPDIDTRMRLKQATTSVIEFGKVYQLNTLNDALTKLDSPDDSCDVIFISHIFSKDDVKAFISKAKETKWGQDCAFIMVLKNEQQESDQVTANVLVGADGLLFEPYSVDYLVEITKLAAKVKLERSEDREKAALNFLIRDVMNQIDLISFLRSRGYDVGRGIKKLKKMCKVFHGLEDESRLIYLDLAVEIFEDAPLPKKIFQQKSYAGASARVRKKMEQKLLEELEAGYVDDDDDDDDTSAAQA